MNPFLNQLALHLNAIRTVLGWSQKDLCDYSGLSRPTIIAIEQGTTQLTRSMAIAIFSSVLYELERRRKQYKQTKLDDANAVAKLLNTFGLSSRSATSWLPGIINGITGVGAAFVTYQGIRTLFRNPSSETLSRTDPQILSNLLVGSLQHVKAVIKESLGLPKLDLYSFFERLDGADQSKGQDHED